MTTIPAKTLSHKTLSQGLFERGAVRGHSEFSWALIFAAALYLAVAITELLIIGLAAPSIAEIGSLYVTTT